MSDEVIEHSILSEDEFNFALARMNAVCGLSSRWQKTSAIKNHVDEFAMKINRGEEYYKREHGGSFSSVLKLSRKSMDKLLYATVHTCPAMESFADLLKEEEANNLMKFRHRA